MSFELSTSLYCNSNRDSKVLPRFSRHQKYELPQPLPWRWGSLTPVSEENLSMTAALENQV